VSNRAGAIAILALALQTAGCAEVKEITPWLRTVTYPPAQPSWDSGGPKATHYLEQQISGRWEIVGHHTHVYLFDNGKRALFMADEGPILLDQSGTRRPLGCPGDVRLVSAESEFVCVFVAQPDAFVGVRHYSHDGTLTRDTLAPYPRTAGKNAEVQFIGFTARGAPVVALSHTEHGLPSFGMNWTVFCDLYSIEGTKLELIKSVPAGADRRCGGPDFWVAHGVTYVRGRGVWDP
jgi:hypothetical protein